MNIPLKYQFDEKGFCLNPNIVGYYNVDSEGKDALLTPNRAQRRLPLQRIHTHNRKRTSKRGKIIETRNYSN